METKKTLRFISRIIEDIMCETEVIQCGCREGTLCPIFADTEGDFLTLSVGDPRSFNKHDEDDSYVGLFECWLRKRSQDIGDLAISEREYIILEDDDTIPREYDAELFETEANNRTYDIIENMKEYYFKEISNRDLQTIDLDDLCVYKFNKEEMMLIRIAMYAQSEGYNFIELL